MRRLSTLISVLFISSFLALIISCGGSSMSMQGRQLQSITVTPSMADPMRSSFGQVQFMAMGHFNMAPMTAAIPVMWSIGNPFSAQPVPAGVSIDAMTGMARCSGFMGTVTIMAMAPMDPDVPISQMSMMTMNVSGSAQLTCP